MRWVLVLAIAQYYGCGGKEPVQPLPFSHAVHAGQEAIACTDCHTGAETAAIAGLPPFVDCLRCHMKPQGEQPNPREQKVRELAARSEPVRWVQVTRNPGHVYFSHRAHVSFADMECSDCHGAVEEWTKPPTRPRADLVSMDACMDCHRQTGASNECLTCHR